MFKDMVLFSALSYELFFPAPEVEHQWFTPRHQKIHLLVLAMITSTPKRKNSGIQKIMYKGMAGNMDYEDQSLLIERARTQSWPGVTQAVFANFGRGPLPPANLLKMKWSSTIMAKFLPKRPWKKFQQPRALNANIAWKLKALAGE